MEYNFYKCVVLNSTYEPLSLVSIKKAFKLVFRGKASVVEEHPYLEYRSNSITFKIPLTVVLKKFVKTNRHVFHTRAILNNRNLFLRDNFTCQYCNRHKTELRSTEILTRDHVIPECRGGNSTWNNLVTACSTCNHKKANYYLHDTNLVLQKTPIAPTIFELLMRHHNNKNKINT
jgi:5-methylcytosine-specific restriction endonuclease McrA